MEKETISVGARRLPRIFPGWWMVVAGSFLNLWGAGYTLYGFSALFKPMATELGFSRAVTSAATSIARLEGGFEAPVTGWLTDRFGPRRVIMVGLSLFALGLMLMYFINSLWAFYVVWGVIVGTGSNIGQGIPINTAITNWFVKKRGIALGIRMMLTAALVLPLITWFIITWGWRMACVIGGIVVVVVGMPLIWFSVKDKRPEYYGLLPDGAKVEGKVTDTKQMIERGIKYAAEIEEREFTLRQAMRTPAYWLLIIVQVTQGMVTQALMLHFVPLLTDMGMSPTKAAATITLTGFTSIASRFFSGLVADRLRTGSLRLVVGGTFLLHAGGLTVFLLNQTISLAYPYLVIHFLSIGVYMIMTSVIVTRYFGRKAIGSIRGSSAMVAMPLGIVGPIFIGWVYDTTGSYTNALTVIASFLVLSAGIMWFVRTPKPPAVTTDITKIL